MKSMQSLLFVEDEEILLEMVTDALIDHGYAVQDARDGTEALRYLNGDAHYDVLVTDMGMPGMSGLELGLEAAKIHPDLPVVLVSGFAKAQLPAVPTGFTYFAKPYRIEQLLRMLEEVTARPA